MAVAEKLQLTLLKEEVMFNHLGCRSAAVTAHQPAEHVTGIQQKLYRGHHGRPVLHFFYLCWAPPISESEGNQMCIQHEPQVKI